MYSYEEEGAGRTRPIFYRGTFKYGGVFFFPHVLQVLVFYVCSFFMYVATMQPVAFYVTDGDRRHCPRTPSNFLISPPDIPRTQPLECAG